MEWWTHSAFAFVFLLAAFDTTHCQVDSHQALKQRLFDLASAQQATEDKAYVPLKQWAEHKGVYKSSIKLNFHGNPLMAEGRRLMDVYDNNMFATTWVTSSLLEAFRYNPQTRPSESQLRMSLDVIRAHRNMNVNYASSTFAFWQQRFNKTTAFWESSPANLLSAFQLLDDLPVNAIEAILKDFGLEKLAKILDQISKSEDMYLQAFHIPPDFDDTFVNLGLGALLFDLKDNMSPAWVQWSKDNSNVTSALDALKKYAYRPFSNDSSLNVIDPRTYYYMRGFLDEAFHNGHDIALVTTWIQNIEELRVQFYKGVAMPFQLNNVDITVAANTIYGLTSSVLSGIFRPDVFDDAEVAQIYLNTSSLIAYMINNNITDRPDLALTYYPSQMEFDWFVARTAAEMDSFVTEKPLPHPVMKEVHSLLTSALKGKMTQSILAKAKKDDRGATYFDDFLGNGDTTLENKTLNRAEDRIFTTAMAANALLYTWGVYSKDVKKCAWKSDVPNEVKSLVDLSVQWLSDHTLDGNYDPWNAFFSGSAKGMGTIPFFYPVNLYEHLNGTEVKDWNKFPANGDRMGMEGYVPKDKYDAMISQKHFGWPTPLVFHGYNGNNSWFPFWSSEAYTYSTTLVALSRYDCIQN